jgi:hypothetical protein
MAKHEIRLDILHGITVMNTDIEIEVREDNEKLGTLHISRGSIDWKPRFGHTARRMRWSQFAKRMEADAPIRRRSR